MGDALTGYPVVVFPPSDPLYAAHTDAALVSGWPRLRVLCPHAEQLQAERGRLEAVLGPLPQADVIEPFDPSRGEPWELRVDLPGLSAATWASLGPSLPPGDHELTPGCPAEVVAADDLGVRLTEWLDGGGLAARMPVAVDDGAQRLDLQRRSDAVDDAVEALEVELARVLHHHDPRLRLISDRGADTVTPVVHRSSGRPGVELAFDPAGFAGLDGDETLALRRAAVAGLAEVVRRRASEAAPLRLAPDPSFSLPLGSLSLVAWIVAPHGAALPGDGVVPDGISPHPVALGQLLRDAAGLVDDLEVQVVAASHEATEAVEAAAPRGWRGHTPRWVHTAAGPRFVPTWRAPLDPDVASVVDRLPGDVRLVPGRLVGLEEEDPWLIRYVVWGRERVALRVRDAVRDRDRVPRAQPRDPAADDAALVGPALAALGPLATRLAADGPLPFTPVAHDDRRGVHLRWPSDLFPTTHELLRQLADAPGLGPWIDWACPRAGGLSVWLWHHGGQAPRQWR